MHNTEFFPLRTWLVVLLCAPTWASGLVHAQNEETPQAEAAEREDRVALIRVHLPLVGNADQALQATLQRTSDRLFAAARRRQDDRRPTIVLHLQPPSDQEAVATRSQFERAFALARFLTSRQMAGIKTIAYVPRSLQGHDALLPLACEEIIMAPEALIGEAGIDEDTEGTIRRTIVAAYQEIAESKRTMPVALAVGMIDAAVEVLQVETEEGIDFVLRNDLEKFIQGREIIAEKVLVPSGTMAQWSGREGREFGFVKYLAANLQAVATVLEVPVQSLEENDALADQWRPMMIDLKGKITPRLAGRVETLIGTVIEQNGCNWIGIRIDSSGGDLGASLRLATTLAGLDANSVRTVGYVSSEAAGGAALVAMACDQLVMHTSARLRYGASSDQPDEAELEAAITTMQHSLAAQSERSWSLLASMVDPKIKLFEYHNKTTGETRLMSSEEVLAAPDAENWQQRNPVQQGDLSLSLDGKRAQELGVALHTVESFDQLKQLYGLQEDPLTAKPNMALELVEALASPEFAILLLMVGFAGIYFELRTPGLGVGAFVGSMGILLYFWSQHLNGTAGWLEVILFVAGLCFVLMEVFVIPGFGIFGLGGAAMIIASIVLASLTFVRPTSESDMDELARSVATVAIAGFGVMIFAMVSRRYLHQVPMFSHMIPAPPTVEELAELDEREALADFSDLVGVRGIATTDLRPTGKAEIDHQLLDVIAEGEPLDHGTPVVVVEARANRVVVRRAGSA